jgi:protein-disulfide isomerase
MKAILLTMTAALLASSAPAQPEKSTEPKVDKPAIEAIVREYILRHPEVLLESVRLHEQRERAAAEERGRKALVTHEEELLRDKATPWVGAQEPEATVVQFFDYRCGYCKRVLPMVSRSAKEPGVRVVYKELPILGPESVLAARLALAANKQGKYREVHESLMSSTAAIKPQTVEEMAKKHGLELEKLKKDMESAEIAQALAKNQSLAGSLGVNSTPTFVIGPELIPGAIEPAQFNALIEQARKKDSRPKP